MKGENTWLNVGYPLHAILPLRDEGETVVQSAIMDYAVEPLSASRYAIWRELQPRGSAFQLNDEPVSDGRLSRHRYK